MKYSIECKHHREITELTQNNSVQHHYIEIIKQTTERFFKENTDKDAIEIKRLDLFVIVTPEYRGYIHNAIIHV